MEPYIRGLIQSVLLAIAVAAGWAGLMFTFHPDGWSVIRCAGGIVLILIAVQAIRVFRILDGRRD